MKEKQEMELSSREMILPQFRTRAALKSFWTWSTFYKDYNIVISAPSVKSDWLTKGKTQLSTPTEMRGFCWAVLGLICGIQYLCCGMQTLSWGMWDLIPRTGTEPRFPEL